MSSSGKFDRNASATVVFCKRLSVSSFSRFSGNVRKNASPTTRQAENTDCVANIQATANATPPPPVDTSLYDDVPAEIFILSIFHKVLHLSIIKKGLSHHLLVITDHQPKDGRDTNFFLPRFLLFFGAINLQMYFCPVYMLTVLLFNQERNKQDAEEKPKPGKKKPEPKPEEKKPKPERKGRRVPQEPREPKTKREGSFARQGMERGFV